MTRSVFSALDICVNGRIRLLHSRLCAARHGGESGSPPLLFADNPGKFGILVNFIAVWPNLFLSSHLVAPSWALWPCSIGTGLNGLSYLLEIITYFKLPRQVWRYVVTHVPQSGFTPLRICRAPRTSRRGTISASPRHSFTSG